MPFECNAIQAEKTAEDDPSTVAIRGAMASTNRDVKGGPDRLAPIAATLSITPCRIHYCHCYIESCMVLQHWSQPAAC